MLMSCVGNCGQVNFGAVSIPRELEYPRSVKLGGLRGVHGVSSDPVIVVDAQTLLVPNFSYDGEAPGTLLHVLFYRKDHTLNARNEAVSLLAVRHENWRL